MYVDSIIDGMKKSKKTLNKKYLKLFNKYLKKFNKKQDTETEHTIDTEIINIADCFLNFYDIRYDIDHKIKPGIIFEWYWDYITHRDINYENATKLFRTDFVKHFKEDLNLYRTGKFFLNGNPDNKEKNLKIKLLSEIEDTIERTNLFIHPPLKLTDIMVYLSNSELSIDNNDKIVFKINSNNPDLNKEFIIPENQKYNLDLRSQNMDLITFIHNLICQPQKNK
jgi:hypothetical protein